MTPITLADTLRRVRVILGRRFHLAPESIRTDARVVDDLGADSLDVLMIASEIEKEFDVEVPDGVVQEARTASEISDRLWQFLQDAAGRTSQRRGQD